MNDLAFSRTYPTGLHSFLGFFLKENLGNGVKLQLQVQPTPPEWPVAAAGVRALGPGSDSVTLTDGQAPVSRRWSASSGR